MHYLYLMAAVLAETIGTTALQASQQFTRLLPSVIVVVAYAASFFLMSLTLKYMPVGIVYAMVGAWHRADRRHRVYRIWSTH